MKYITVLCVVSALLAGCATVPLSVPVKKTATVTKPKDEVWANLVEFFATNNISIKTIEKDSGIIYAERANGKAGSISLWASCGGAFGVLPLQESLDLNVFVRQTPNNESNVTVNASFHQTVKNGWDGGMYTQDCNSLGVLEEQLLSAAGS